MKRILRLCAACIIAIPPVLLATTGLAAAHVLKQDNGMSVVLHIPPEDNPEAGENTKLEFAFANGGETFSLAHCDCNVAVESNNKTIQTTPIYAAATNDELDGEASVRFPSVGIYDLVVTGQSINHSFGAFSLDYLERVASSVNGPPASPGSGSDVVIIGAGSLVILAMVAYNAILKGGRYTTVTSIKKRPVKKGKAA